MKAEFNDNTTHEVTKAISGYLLNANGIHPDIEKISPYHYFITLNHKKHEVFFLRYDLLTSSLLLKINGKRTFIQLTTQSDQLLETIGFDKSLYTRMNEIKAPMPGLIKEIHVNIGDTVQAGSPVLVLVAMKMENIIKATGDAVVKSIKVKEEQAVDKNDVLVEFE